jgi:hypothetical protein
MKTKYQLLFELIIICCSLFILCSQSTRLSVMAQAAGFGLIVTDDSQINKCETKTYTVGVQNNSGNPLLDYTPPDIAFTYCEDQVDVNFTVSNIGDGTAHDVWMLVDFGSLTVSNVSAGAIYNNITVSASFTG